MNREVGSEFWNCEPIKNNKVFVLSGRTALEFIIQDILKSRTVSSVLLPSYCCHTMIEPFCRHGLNIRFYDVLWNEKSGLTVEVPDLIENEIFYYISYFGYTKLQGFPDERVKRDAEVIIEDQTHSWLSCNYYDAADYSYVSYRKWTGFTGLASASKANGGFSSLPNQKNEKYCNIRNRAIDMKRKYIRNGFGDKQAFLSLFTEAEVLLETDYVGYLPEIEAVNQFLNVDICEMQKNRRRNATILQEGIKGIDGIKCMFSSITDSDVPLFVPVLVPEGRDRLRKHLIDNSIYCPIHWPLSVYHTGISEKGRVLYEHELSLICDQRYDEKDMDRIVQVLWNYSKR